MGDLMGAGLLFCCLQGVLGSRSGWKNPTSAPSCTSLVHCAALQASTWMYRLEHTFLCLPCKERGFGVHGSMEKTLTHLA